MTKSPGFSRSELAKALEFEGYGRKSAPYWFLGIEEGGGSIEELTERVRLFDPVEDLLSAHQKLGLEGTMRRHVPTWRVMSKIVMALEGRLEWQQATTAREYQATELGRVNGDTFLTELMPLPSPSTADWPYELIFPTRSQYFAEVRPRRIEWLRSEVSASHPDIIVCYGKGNWHHHQEIFSDVVFMPELNEKIRVGERGDTTILLLPFLSYDLVTTELIANIADMFGNGQMAG
ncbi:MAG: hypothetical protein HQ478_13610 [Chloroflexi bacterium]|nr:hypothetical protein [Chloroflexota bacterium]